MIVYEEARRAMTGLLPLPSRPLPEACWLALGAAVSRARRMGRTEAHLRDAPSFESLTAAERHGLAACWRLLGPEPTKASEVAGDYPFLLPALAGLEQAIADLRSTGVGLTPDRKRLRDASLRRTDYCAQGAVGQGARPLSAHIAYLLDLCRAIEARYGARRDSLPDPRGFTLSVLEADAHWLARHRDPDFWHILVPTLIELSYVTAFARQVLPTLNWILSQPDCDRGTAAAAFLMLDGPRLAPVPAGAAQGRDQQAERQAQCQAIVARAAGGLYAGSGLSPQTLGLDGDYSARVHGATLPAALFAQPFDLREPVTPFYIEDGTILMAMI